MSSIKQLMNLSYYLSDTREVKGMPSGPASGREFHNYTNHTCRADQRPSHLHEFKEVPDMKGNRAQRRAAKKLRGEFKRDRKGRTSSQD